ncbi:peptidylprolyl isomerase [Gayadomonas joobiniege]|uniref:peptidylprolyl isomerase n=1 Tax=Gayadomonas joobiniege TaxID=1234606 RepID=UPI0003617A56|nr:peptidylprolyl isomerase [Gayadomonas joobiniege]
MLVNKKYSLIKAALIAAGLLTVPAQATIVKVETNLGDFEINLYDETTPKTVANFLDYVDSGAYTNTVVHRSIEDFVIQAGSYNWSIDEEAEPEQTEEQLNLIETNDPVTNEPVWSNLKTTVAMAKGSNEDSATSGWFVNLNDDNAENLDVQSGGFTVFGEVVSGYDVVEAINELETYYLASSISDIPLYNLPEDSTSFEKEHLVLIKQITVIDSSVDSAKDLTPTANSEIYQNNLDTIDLVVDEITLDVEKAEEAYSDAKIAVAAAKEISEEKGEIAEDALSTIESQMLILDQKLADAEDFAVQAQNLADNDASVLEIIEIRKASVEVYYDAVDANAQINTALNTAEDAATEASDSGGSMPAWFVLGGLLLAAWSRRRD